MEHDSDDPIPVESAFWGFWNRFAEDWMRTARLFGLIALLIALGIPYSARAQQASNYGVVCDTPDQVRRVVRAQDHKAILTAINSEKPHACAVINVLFYPGNTEGKIVTEDGIWTVTHALIVGIIQHGGHVQPIEPKPQWIAVVVESEGV